MEQGRISRQVKIGQSGREHFLYRDDDLIALAKFEAFRAILRLLRDESRHYSVPIEKGVPRADAAKQAFHYSWLIEKGGEAPRLERSPFGQGGHVTAGDSHDGVVSQTVLPRYCVEAKREGRSCGATRSFHGPRPSGPLTALQELFQRFLSTVPHSGAVLRCRRGSAVGFACRRSVEIEADLEPRGVTGELQVPAEIRQLFNFCGQHSCLGDMLLAAADTVTGFGEEATLAGA